MQSNMIKLKPLIEGLHMDPKASKLGEVKRIARIAKKHASYFLEQTGLEYPDQFTMKIKTIPGKGYEDALAIYKIHSILSGRPVFWMNSNLPDMVAKWDDPMPIIRVLTDNIIHEWWHAISELLRVMKYGQQRKVRTPIPKMYGPTEEREAVAFVGWAFYGKEKVMEPYFKLAIKEFNSFSVYD